MDITETGDMVDATKTLTTIDLNEIENNQKAMRAKLEQQIADLCKATKETMQKQMSDTFRLQMGQLELCIEKNTKSMLAKLSNSFQTAVICMTEQAKHSEQLFHAFKNDVTYEITHQIESVLPQSMPPTMVATTTPKTGSSPSRPDKFLRTDLYPIDGKQLLGRHEQMSSNSNVTQATNTRMPHSD